MKDMQFGKVAVLHVFYFFDFSLLNTGGLNREMNLANDRH